MIDRNSKAEQFMFARWMATCYSSECLNMKDGYWWKEQLEYFTISILPEYKRNGSYKETVEFLKQK